MAVFLVPGQDKGNGCALILFFIIFFLSLTVLGLCCRMDFSLVAECWGCSLVAVHGLLTVMASLVAQPRL